MKPSTKKILVDKRPYVMDLKKCLVRDTRRAKDLTGYIYKKGGF